MVLSFLLLLAGYVHAAILEGLLSPSEGGEPEAETDCGAAAENGGSLFDHAPMEILALVGKRS
jgi:hypothetical protein